MLYGIMAFDDVVTKSRDLNLYCLVGGLLFGLILATLVVGNLFMVNPELMMTLFSGTSLYILWSVCIVLGVLTTCFLIRQIKKFNVVVKEAKKE